MLARSLYQGVDLIKRPNSFFWISRLNKRANFSGKSGDGLSRTERRLLERKARNKERKQTARARNERPKEEKIINHLRLHHIRHRLAKIFIPKIPGGGNLYFRLHHFTSLGYRIPLFLAFCFLLTNEDYFPFVIQGSIGPSMLPTIQFIGDLWLIETWAWHRLLGFEIPLQIGDVIIWKDPTTQRVSCKRIIGIEGDEVARFGQYVQLYKDRKDLGIILPSDAEARNLNLNWDGNDGKARTISETTVVPNGHVWIEGDCPPFSLDSRHFGPISTSWIRGRLLYRVWPMQREDEDGNLIPLQVSRKRPLPFPSIESYLGKRFNFYRISGEDNKSE